MASGAVKGRAGLKPIGMYGFGAGGAAVPMSKRVFDKYDTDKSGKISPAEFKEMVYELGYHLSDVEFDLAIKLLDKDGDKEISYSEFAEWWRTEDRFSKLQVLFSVSSSFRISSFFPFSFDLSFLKKS
ncbi:MAG: EF-hand domain-containing protein [archaeon]|nr:EF-hand domain-containing protein [archaeon]